MLLGLAQREPRKQERTGCWDHRDAVNRADPVERQDHQPDGRERSEQGADRIERLPQPECAAADLGRGLVGDHCVARAAPYALADAVGEARAHDHCGAGREREQGL
jgi:hypothetical protein